MLDSILGLAENLAKFRDASEQGFAEVGRQLDDLWPALSRQTAPTGAAPPPAVSGPLPTEVSVLFDEALGALSADVRLPGLLRRAFNEGPESAGARRQITSVLRQPKFPTTVGVIGSLRLLIESFRRAVTDWYRTASADDRGFPDAAHRRQLDEMGKVFDTLLGFLPVYEVGWLADQLVSAEESGRGILDDSLRGSHLLDAQDVLAELSARVRAQVLAGFDSDRPS